MTKLHPKSLVRCRGCNVNSIDNSGGQDEGNGMPARCVEVPMVKRSEASEAYLTQLNRYQAFEQLSDDVLIDKFYVCHLFSCSVATVWRWCKDGRLPVPVRLGARATRWRVGDLRRCLRSLSEVSD